MRPAAPEVFPAPPAPLDAAAIAEAAEEIVPGDGLPSTLDGASAAEVEQLSRQLFGTYVVPGAYHERSLAGLRARLCAEHDARTSELLYVNNCSQDAERAARRAQREAEAEAAVFRRRWLEALASLRRIDPAWEGT